MLSLHTLLAILMTTTLGPALGDDADDLGGGYCIYGLLAMLMMLMMPVALLLCCCRRPKPKIGKQTDESAEEETPEERDQEGTIGTCHEKKYKKDDDLKNPDNRRYFPMGNVLVTKYGECWHVSRDCKALRHSRSIESKRPCPYCCLA